MKHNLDLISQWAHDWMMSHNPNQYKQAVKLLNHFSCYTFNKKKGLILQGSIYRGRGVHEMVLAVA